MKLINFDFYLDWPVSVEVRNLRKYVMKNLLKEGKVIRWAIIDIEKSVDVFDTKKLKIKAVLADRKAVSK